MTMDEMTSCYQEMIKAHGWLGTAAQMNMTRSQLEARVYEVKGSGMRVSTAQLLQRISGTTLFAEAVAAEAGGVFFELPDEGDVKPAALLDKFLQLQTLLGNLSAEYRKAVEDNVIDSGERRSLKSIEMDMHKTMCELMSAMFKLHCRHPVVPVELT